MYRDIYGRKQDKNNGRPVKTPFKETNNCHNRTLASEYALP